MARVVRSLADDVCGGRLVLILEGGYAATGLREGTDAVLDVLLEPAPPPPPADRPLTPALEAVVERLAHVHGKNFSGLGAG